MKTIFLTLTCFILFIFKVQCQFLCNWNHYYLSQSNHYNFDNHISWIGGAEFITLDKTYNTFTRIAFPPDFRNLNTHNCNFPNSLGFVYTQIYMLRPGPNNSTIAFAASPNTQKYYFDGYNYSPILSNNYFNYDLDSVYFITNKTNNDIFIVNGIKDTIFIKNGATLEKIHPGNSPYKGNGSQYIHTTINDDI